jgi:uncharacterized protein YdaU (DUF1376 family)
MHYYSLNIADYRKDTQHLSPIEHYIYRELMDWYYLDESPIPKITKVVIRRLRLVIENEPDLTNVLDEFFTDTHEGWAHSRIEEEIARYHAKVDTARANGSKGGRPKKPKKTTLVNSANPEITGSKANQEPITKNQEPLKDKTSVGKPTTRKVFKPPVAQEVSEYLAEKQNTSIDPNHFLDFYSARGWKLSSGTKMADWKAAVRTWISRESKNANTPGNGPRNINAPRLSAGDRVRAAAAVRQADQARQIN